MPHPHLPEDETSREAIARHEVRIWAIELRQEDRMKAFEDFRAEIKSEIKTQNNKIEKHGAWINKALGIAIAASFLGGLFGLIVEWVKR